MHRNQRLHHASASCRLLVWCMLLALPIYGLSGTLIQLLGPAHFHRDVAVSAAKANPVDGPVQLVDFRRDNVSETTLTPAQLHELSHRQHPFTRHFHAADDSTVVAIDGSAEQASPDGGASTSGSACLTLGLVDALCLGQPPYAVQAWRVAEAWTVRSRDPQPLERPPRA